MPAPTGNTYYLLRKSCGASKIFETPEIFEDKCNEYFEWCVNNPIQAEEIHNTKLGVERVMVDKVRVVITSYSIHYTKLYD